MYRLICQQDPRALGIERSDGAWDLAVFDIHRQHCAPCRSFNLRLAEEMGMATEEACTTGQPTSGSLAISASAEIVLREVIDLLDQTRHTFKSKQIQRARERLDALLRAQHREGT